MILNADYDFGDYYNDDCGDHESLVGVHLKKKVLAGIHLKHLSLVGIHLTNTLSFYLSPGELLLRQNRICGQSEQSEQSLQSEQSTTNNLQSLQSEQSNTNNLQSLQNQPYQIVICNLNNLPPNQLYKTNYLRL